MWGYAFKHFLPQATYFMHSKCLTERKIIRKINGLSNILHLKKQLSKEKALPMNPQSHATPFYGWDGTEDGYHWLFGRCTITGHSFQFFGEIFVLSVKLHTQWLFVNECKFVDYWSLENSRMRRNYQCKWTIILANSTMPDNACNFTAASVKFVSGCQDASSFR